MITIFDAPRCPYCARTRIVLAEKDIPYDSVVVDLDDRPAWIIEKNPPFGRVPVLEEGGWVLPESAVIGEYLEDRYPEQPLLPADAGLRAAARLLIFRFEEFSGPYYLFRRGEPNGEAAFRSALDWLDGVLSATRYLTGPSFGLADVAYVPWVLRARDNLGVDLAPYPAVADWLADLAERPSIAAELDIVAAL